MEESPVQAISQLCSIRPVKEFLTALTAVLPVFAIMGISLRLRWRGWPSADADASLMRVTINLLLPSLIFDSVLGHAALRRPENLLLPPLIVNKIFYAPLVALLLVVF